MTEVVAGKAIRSRQARWWLEKGLAACMSPEGASLLRHRPFRWLAASVPAVEGDGCSLGLRIST
jgi:hypothetical protein